MNSVALLIGGNQGDREALIAQATVLIRHRIGTVVAASSDYETAPWGTFDEAAPQPFLNRALLVETTLSATATLQEALEIEKALGRTREAEPASKARIYHSRPMDIDLIFFNDEVIDTPGLQIPHPRMHLRRFVLEPLAEIIPDYRHPLLGRTITELLQSLPEARQGIGTQAGVERSATPAHTVLHTTPEPPQGVEGLHNNPATHSVGSKKYERPSDTGVKTPACRPITHSVGFMVLFFLWLFPLSGLAQRSYTLSGTVTDARSGETLIGATVLDTRSGKGTVTNLYGHYSLTLKSDSVNLRVTFVGYEPQHFDLLLDRHHELNVRLRQSVTLDEVTITAERTGDVRSVQMSAMEMPVEKIKAVPVLFGEADLIKALQLMPGVQSGSEGTNGMYVRGGGPDENLFLLDGVPLYNVSHLGGFFSAFNTDAIKSVTLYKGSFPARFGGRLSSVLDVMQNNGNDQQLHGNASIGLISAKLNLEGPIVKERTTFSLSARRTYAELFIIPAVMWINAMSNEMKGPDVVRNADLNAGYWFYDLNAKLTHKFSDKSRLYGSFYMGDDKVYGGINTVSSTGQNVKLGFENQWGNLIGALRWNYELSPKLFLNLSAAYTQYKNRMLGHIVDLTSLHDTNNTNITGDYASSIRDITLRADLDYTPSPEHTVRFGATFVRHIFNPEVISSIISYYDPLYMNGAYRDTLKPEARSVLANEMTAFAEDDWSITDAIKLNYGLHLSGFKVENSFYPSLQPRVSGRVMLTPDFSLKVGYAWMRQYVHLLSTTSITLPTDLWVPVTDHVKPMESHQVAGGVFYSLTGIADFSVEAYYKAMNNLIEYRDGATFFGSSEHWENLVYAGRGWSYGIEVLAQREIGRLTGWVGYTWSRTMRLFDREGQVINNGKPFPAKYDRRHDISIVLNYKFSDRVDVSATWVYSTGNTATLPMQTYAVASEDPDDYDNIEGHTTTGTLTRYEGRNNYRMPVYHRMDLAANFHRQFKATRHGFRPRRTINVSIYNVYNRQNPYMIYKSAAEPYGSYSSSLQQLSLFPILPSVAYTLYF